MVNYGLLTLVAPTEEPVTLAELKSWLRVNHSLDDNDIVELGKAAREYCEDITRRQFVTASYRMTIDVFPYGTAELQFLWNRFGILKIPKPPLVTVDRIQYVQFGGAIATHDPSLYQVDTTTTPGRVAPSFSQVWPIAQYTTFQAVRVEYTCGYGAAAAVPARLKLCVKMIANTMYNNRETTAEQAANDLPGHFKSFLRSLGTGEYE